MDNLSQSLPNSSWENPFGLSGNVIPCDLESDEQFLGDELKAFFDKEEKLYQSASSVKSDQSQQTEKSNAGITLRSFMVESGDSDLIQQKLTMSQYLAYKSEPMGPELGDSASFRERPYFSFQDKSLQSSSSEKSQAEFNPDFSQEPSWMKKKSLSSLSSSENLDIPSKSPDSSENWLIGNNKSESHSSLVDNTEKSDTSLHMKEPNIQLEEKHLTSVEFKQPPCLTPQEIEENSELPSLYWKPHKSHIDVGQSHLESVLEKEALSDCHSYVAGHVESLSLGSDSSRRPSEIAASSQSSSSPASTIRENTYFPRCDSLISEPQLSSTREITDDYIDLSSSEKHVRFLPDLQHTEISHITMETQNLRLGSILEVSSNPNLCSTAMIPAAKTAEHVMHLLENISKKNITADQEQEDLRVTSRVNQVSHVETTSRNLDLEWERIERELTQHETNGFSPESWLAIFSNTSSLSTPLLMNKIREHVNRLNGRGMSSELLPSESSGIGGSGFEMTESRADSACVLQTNKSTNDVIPQPSVNNNDIFSRTSSGNFNPLQQKLTEPKQQSVIPISLPPTFAEIEGKVMKSRHTLSVMSTRSTANRELQTPIDQLAKSDFSEKDFARLTSTVIKKIPVSCSNVNKPSGVSQVKAKIIESDHSLQGPLVKCNKSQVYFGGARIRHKQIQNVVVRNSSFKCGLELELRIKDSEDFLMLDENRSLVSRRNLQLEPRQECCIDLVFQPLNLGPLTTKLNIYPRCESAKKIKYTVDLFGYGGSSLIQQLAPNTTGQERHTLVPKSKGTFWNCQLVLENRGNVAGFTFIQPLKENGEVMESFQCIPMPQCCSMNAGDSKEIEIFIHPSKDGKLTSLKLQLVWGDEPMRARWIRCISNGAPIKPPNSELNKIDWNRLLQLECKDSTLKPAVSEEDMVLFFNNATVEEISIIIPENGHDSNFVTLAAEPATVLESSNVSDTMLSQRRLTTANSGKSSSDVVSAAITELGFPSTKVGTVSSQKIPLQNWSGTKQEVRVKEISGPFVMKHNRNAVPGGYFTRLPIQFHPITSGSHSGYIVLDVGQNGQSLTIALKGDAY